MAIYTSVNELDKFHFHDAEFAAIYRNDENLIWKLQFANVKKENSQSNCDYDMQAGIMRITFYDYKIIRFDIFAPGQFDKFGNIVKMIPVPILKSDYDKHFLSFVEDGGNIKSHTQIKNEAAMQSYNFFISTGPEVYELDLDFLKVIAEWDTFESKAWYEK